jgi:SAM-dependent methyltransferase
MISLRRLELNKNIIKYSKYINGKVLDVGGKKFTKNLIKKNIDYRILNKDKKNKPFYLADASKIPTKKNYFDTVIMFEVIEYLENYDKVFMEIKRVLKKNSYFIFSSPFLVPIHYDRKYDLQRFTRKKLEMICKKNNFKIIKIIEMGSVGSCLYDIIRISITYASRKKNFILKFLLRLSIPLFKIIDLLNKEKKNFINSGYFFIVKKS